jgi:GDP-4-dehydro-6-deoxy-D-mannose reductase
MKQPVAFITGIPGFAGSFLAEELLAHDYKVIGTLREGESIRNLQPIENQLTLITADILDSEHYRKLVQQFKPDYVFHLAAMASVGRSFEMERMTFLVNFEGTLNVLDAARSHPGLKKFIYISSADCYGIFSPKNKTLQENQPLNPISPYGISKAASEQAVQYYYRAYGLPATVSRSFNHSGPRQSDSFAIPSFAHQIAAIEIGRQKPELQVGDLSVKRDVSDVRDIVSGYRLLAEKAKPGSIFHLCSGKAIKVQKILEMLLTLSRVKISVKVDKSRLRKADIPVLRGDNHKAVRELGYKIKYPLKTTLMDTLNYWRHELSL